MFKKILSHILSISIIVETALNPISAIANQEVQQERTIEHIKQLLGGSVPSDIPVAGVTKSAVSERALLIKNKNLSQYAGANIFVGYGVYDLNQNNCKYVEKPGVTKDDYKAAFVKRIKFAQHYYGITDQKMDYASCNALAIHLGGKPVVIDTSGEKSFIVSKFLHEKVNGNYLSDIWTGIFRKTCNDPNFYNANGVKQEYLPFSRDYDRAVCDENKKNTYMNKNGKLMPANPYEQHYCLVEFDTEDMYRPIKICAPWWRIIREYKKSLEDMPFDLEFLKQINQADIPRTMNVCIQYNNEGVNQLADDRPARIVQCTTYYSRTAAPECLKSMYQPQCFVNECKGYIENACTLEKEKITGKGYVKGTVVIDGQQVEVRIKDNVKTRMYKCPPSPLSNKYCLQSATVTVYPKECPGSDCDAYRECIFQARSNHPNDSAAQKQEADQCRQQYKCEKIFPSRDLPLTSADVNTQTGEVYQLRGKCSDGTILTFPVNIQSKHGRKCLEREWKEATKKVVEKCLLDRPYEDVEVDMSVVETDPYESRPECVRMDKVKDSQRKIQTNFSVETKGFFKHKVSVLHIDKNVTTVLDVGDDSYLVDNGRYPTVTYRNITQGIVEPNITVQSFMGLDSSGNPIFQKGEHDSNFCSVEANGIFDGTNPNTKMAAFLNRMYDIFYDGSEGNPDDNIGVVAKTGDSSGRLHVILKTANVPVGSKSKIDNNSDCLEYAKEHGFDQYVYAFKLVNTSVYDHFISSRVNPNAETCEYQLKSMEIDQYVNAVVPTQNQAVGSGFTSLRIDMNPPSSAFQNFKDKKCMAIAFCMGGAVSDSGTGTCNVVLGEETDEEEFMKAVLGDQWRDANKDFKKISETDPEFCKPSGSSYSKSAILDALENIAIFEDYAEGGFGYTSNHTYFPIKSSSVKVSFNGSDYTLPIEEMRYIDDAIHYHAVLHHIAYRSKKPNLLLVLAGGGVAAGIAKYFNLINPLIASIVVIVIILLLTRSKKMDQQQTEYLIYKDIPKKYYPINQYHMYDARLTPDEVKKSKEEIKSKQKNHHVLNFINIDLSAEDSAKFVRRIYFHWMIDTGKDKPGPTKERLRAFLKEKRNRLYCMGFEKGEVTRMEHPDEKDNNYGHPKCKWYNPWCEKSRHYWKEVVTNDATMSEIVETTVTKKRSGTSLINKQRMTKIVGGAYLGAVNNLVILVPYIGNYRIDAYNKYGDLLASRIIYESSFTQDYNSADGLMYAQVNFGMSMNLAPGIDEGTNDKACRMDRMVEWGGGVSGVFFESQRTDENQHCQKSNDAYVFDQSMTRIYIQPLNADDGFEYNLTKPMPYPNRVWIATMNLTQKRHYRCYKDFAECGDENFQPEEGN